MIERFVRPVEASYGKRRRFEEEPHNGEHRDDKSMRAISEGAWYNRGAGYMTS